MFLSISFIIVEKGKKERKERKKKKKGREKEGRDKNKKKEENERKENKGEERREFIFYPFFILKLQVNLKKVRRKRKPEKDRT